MKTMGAAKFKEQCLALLDRLDADLIGSLQHKIEVKGDILTTGVRWDADAES